MTGNRTVLWHRTLPAILALVFFLAFMAKGLADTPRKDLLVRLYIEINDSDEDFDDATETVEKGRHLTYLVEVQNAGNQMHEDIAVLMDIPDYMKYVPDSTLYLNTGISQGSQTMQVLPDLGATGPLQAGYHISLLYPGASALFKVGVQVEMPADDPLYTLAWANALGKYAVAPLVSNLIETKISGEAKADVSVVVEAFPPEGEPVDRGTLIDYQYQVRNVGGLRASGIVLTTYLPANTTCLEACGVQQIGALLPGESREITMRVRVNDAIEGVSQIENTGFDLAGLEIGFIENRTSLIHPVGEGGLPAEGDFTVDITQEPNIILNSANGLPRPDGGDLTETIYNTKYVGRQKWNTYPILSTNDDYTFREGQDCSQWYPHRPNTHTFAYNSAGDVLCDGHITTCPPTSSAIQFNVTTILPSGAPKLVPTIENNYYFYGMANPDYTVNRYMQNGEPYQVPRIFTESRAVENGANGIVEAKVEAIVMEDKWEYRKYSSHTCYISCGEDTCPIEIDDYRWEKVNSTPVTLADTDTANIDVYTSTAWLKTEGGHLGTNDRFTGGSLTEANYVDLGNPVIKPNFLTPSDTYTPPGETNSEFMIFGKNGTGAFQSASGDDWLQTGTEFPFLERGEAYDRADNPRDFYQDLLDREMYGPVKTDQLENLLTGTVNIGDGIIWSQTGDLTIGRVGGPEVVFEGGQSRIYSAGDVYINADIRLAGGQGQSYKDITVLRIDARNIYINGSVANLEVMLLARENFYSGISKNQLRILGDVIAGRAFWQRQPLLEFKPEDFNKPSEHLIEDLRKYVIPVPGDTTVPDDYNVWRQVNPATGQTLDAY